MIGIFHDNRGHCRENVRLAGPHKAKALGTKAPASLALHVVTGVVRQNKVETDRCMAAAVRAGALEVGIAVPEQPGAFSAEAPVCLVLRISVDVVYQIEVVADRPMAAALRAVASKT